LNNDSRSRRHLGVALAAIAAVALAGCTDPTPSPDATSEVGDLLTVAVAAPATGINPASVNTAFADFATIAYEPLIRFSPGGNYEPGLAESWTVGDGNTTMSLQLRDGVEFSDGTAVTAEAVKASLEYCASETSVNAQVLQDLASIEVTGELNLEIELSAPNPLFEYMLTQRQGCGMIISPAGLDNIDDLTVDAESAGAGPYIYQPSQSVPGDSYTYAANPLYFEPERQHYRTIVLKVIAQPQAALNALTTGQIDMATGDLSTAAQAAGTPGIQIASTPFIWAGLNLIDRDGETTAALGDVRVRQAINYAIDREAVATALLGEFGVATGQPSAEGFDGWSQEAADFYSYDPQKAKDLLAEAGYADGFDLPVITVAFGGLDTLTTAITPMLAEVGIRVNALVSTDEKTYIDGMYNRQYSAAAVGYGSQPMYLMGTALVLPSALPFNGFGTDDPTAVGLVDQIRSADADAQAAYAQELNLYLVEQAWFAPVMFGPVLYYAREGLAGVEVSGEYPTISVLDVSNGS